MKPRVMTRAERQRHAAAELIRYMDCRDLAAADALLARIGSDIRPEENLDAVARWVWRIEAERAISRRWPAVVRWYRQRALLAELIAVLADLLDDPPQSGGTRNAA